MRRPWWRDRRFWLDWRAWLALVAVSIVPIVLWVEHPAGAATDLMLYAIAMVVIGAAWLCWRDHRILSMRSQRRAHRRDERKRARGFSD